MKIIQLTPGTGAFHCGSCLRDHALVSGLKKLGHDAVMLPMYLPLVLEDDHAPEHQKPIFFGGINVYLQHHVKLFHRTPRWLDRFLDSRALLRMAGRRAGMTSARQLGEMTLSMLQGEEGRQRKELDRLVEALNTSGKPDVVLLSNVMLVGMARRIRESLGVPIICTLQGEDGFLDALPEPYREQAWATLADRVTGVEAFIAVSDYYAGVMRSRLGLDDHRVRVVHNGIQLCDFAPAALPPADPTIGYLARMHHTKGLHTLVDAFIAIHDAGGTPNARLHVAGAMTATDRPYVNALKAKLAKRGLLPHVRFDTNITREQKIAFLRGLSVFSVPATYGEAFGLYVLESLACGVPVVQPRHGAFPELIARTQGGILCEPDDVNGLASALTELLHDRERAKHLADAGRKVVVEHFNEDRMAAQVAEVCDHVADM